MFKKIVFYLLARRFVAGETADDAIRVAKRLAEKNIYAIINILGEHIKDQLEVDRICGQYIELILRLAREGLWKCHVSIKPSQLGSEISEDLFKEKLEMLLTITRIILPEGLLEIDAEEPGQRELIEKVCLRLAGPPHNFLNMRVCCQMRYPSVIETIHELKKAGLSVRLCKGAYPGGLIDEEKLRVIFLEYTKSGRAGLPAGRQVVAATHDPWLLERLYGKVEIQVLLGIENNMADGVYVPFGPNWWPYGKRRWKSILKILWRSFMYKIGRRN